MTELRSPMGAPAARLERSEVNSGPRHSLRFPALVLAFALASCAANPAPATPLSPEGAPAASEEPAPTPSSALAPGVKRTDTAAPEERTISNADCATLGKRLGELTRSDEGNKVSPKLKPQLREKAMKSIDDAAVNIESQWITNCQTNLVGKVADPDALKCAVDAKSVKAFDVCLNGEEPPSKK